MRILLLFIYFIFIYSCGFLKAQQIYSDLNASTGNEGQYIIDADTNIYMYHRNQIEKLDKNFNPIWVKTYSGLDFYSLLLSKNGSLYFIASDTINYSTVNNGLNTKYIGKIDVSGNLVWCKIGDNSSLNLSVNFYKLLLDRNNDLMASCNLGLMKLDTTGNMYYVKHIQTNLGTGQNIDIRKTTILKDSSGYYSCAFTWQAFETAGTGYFKYNEVSDTFLIERSFNEYPQFWNVYDAWFYQSKYDENVYYSISVHSLSGPGNYGRFFSVRKHNNENIVWNKKFGYSTYPYIITSFDEDKNKNVLFNISPASMGYHTWYTNDNIKLDSNGVHNGIKSTLLNYTWWPPSAQYESAKLQSLYNNNYFYTVVGNGFPSNPLSVSIIDSTLFSNCAATSTMTIANEAISPIGTDTILIKQSLTPYLLQDKVITVTPILNFTIAPNYCTVLGVDNKRNGKEEDINFYPNPCQNNLNIRNEGGLIISSIYIIDIYGKQIKVDYENNQIKTGYLSNGIYFLKIQTDKGEFNQKFIKE